MLSYSTAVHLETKTQEGNMTPHTFPDHKPPRRYKEHARRAPLHWTLHDLFLRGEVRLSGMDVLEMKPSKLQKSWIYGSST